MPVLENSAPRENSPENRPPGPEDTFGVYIHWPFCASKCPYCDFNSHVAETIDQDRWRRALISELNTFALETPGRTVTSIFFGGGTPSLMEPETAAALIAQVRRRWASEDGLEITLEANPTSVESGRFRALRDSGVNRLSLGVQSFRDRNLAFLGRGHSAEEAKKALVTAADVFPRFSFDLIYGLPDQTAADWARDLDDALDILRDLGGDHFSLYQLSIEKGTDFYRDRVQGATEETGAELYEITQTCLSGAAMPAYEISNHARPGGECRHNLNIWRGGQYLGIGPGAHGRIARKSRMEAQYRIADPARWLSAVEAKGHGTAKRLALSRSARAEEVLMTGLRLRDGISFSAFRAATGRDLDASMDPGGLERMKEGGFVEADDERLRATATGMLCLNEVLRHLLT
ncbi:MAG: radical SAM family heme chaperone HemW [Rhodospirillales bacterium]